ncbi:MAG: chemotaxis protein CheW [Halothiobacillaceae bacterium]|jgi:twitching motility protein PilI|nr:chemotaxis protein CheW [Halothiobacillaceae bacterium]MDY0050670.1 chemotaxis protein CheW [Halothiobacillaceae bacterium]
MVRADTAFDYFREIDRLAARNAAGMPKRKDPGKLWQGLVYKVGDATLVTPLDQIAAILPVPRLVRVPGAKPWALGVANVRGSLTALFDMHGFLYGSNILQDRRSTVLVCKSDQLNAALIVSASLGLRNFLESAREPSRNREPALAACVEYDVRDGQSVYPVFDFARLYVTPSFRDVVAKEN